MISQNLANKLLDSLGTAVVLMDADFNVCHINTAAETMLAISLQRAKGMPAAELFVDQDFDMLRMIRKVDSGRSYTRRKAQLVLSTRKSITVDLQITPFEEGFLLELHGLDRMLKISREDDLLTSHQTSRAMVRGLAHEIKNPLGGLRGAAQLLDRELSGNELADYTKIIIEEADRLRNLVDRLLGPNTPHEKSSVNIHEVLERVRQLIEVESENQIHFHRDYDPSIPEIDCDAEQLIQAILNIVRNAMQALDYKGWITLRSRTLRQFTIGKKRYRLVLRIDIEDQGPGIPPEILENIFLPMISGRAEGTGLGLSISQSIVTQHNGLIECSSVPGNTRFSLYLPFSEQDKKL